MPDCWQPKYNRLRSLREIKRGAGAFSVLISWYLPELDPVASAFLRVEWDRFNVSPEGRPLPGPLLPARREESARSLQKRGDCWPPSQLR